jgi:cytochrome c-type biogenesis protein CcmH
MRDYIRQRIAAGATKTEIKDALVEQFGESVLAAPPKKGFNLLAGVLPFVGIVAAGAVLGALVWRWSRSSRDTAPPSAADTGDATPALDPSLERRLDEELARFDG